MTPRKSSIQSPLPTRLTSRLLESAGFQHGFFTRIGGASDGVFDSLNFASGSGDAEENVVHNRGVVAHHLQVPPSNVFYLSQVHGTHASLASVDCQQEEFLKQEGDIVWAKDGAVAAAIRTADCVPILFACKATGWVAACHSGWQGCERGAAIATVKLLKEKGATDLICAIGPHISLASFEVSDDVAERLKNASPNPDIVHRDFAKPHVDLRKMVHSQLHSAGLQAQDIDDVMGCTVLDEELYFSFRRDGNPSGRMLSAICPRR